jgi:hypothetical protein
MVTGMLLPGDCWPQCCQNKCASSIAVKIRKPLGKATILRFYFRKTAVAFCPGFESTEEEKAAMEKFYHPHGAWNLNSVRKVFRRWEASSIQ